MPITWRKGSFFAKKSVELVERNRLFSAQIMVQ